MLLCLSERLRKMNEICLQRRTAVLGVEQTGSSELKLNTRTVIRPARNNSRWPLKVFEISLS